MIDDQVLFSFWINLAIFKLYQTIWFKLIQFNIFNYLKYFLNKNDEIVTIIISILLHWKFKLVVPVSGDLKEVKSSSHKKRFNV